MICKVCQFVEVDFGLVECKNCQSSKNTLNVIKQGFELDNTGMLTHQELPQIGFDYFS